MKILITALALLAASPGFAQSTPYAGQERRAVKSLSPAEVDDLLAGRGMGLAKAAELNGYPGPAHVLEHADALQLTAAQRQATQALMQRHQARARTLGLALVESEQALDRAFARREIDAASLAALTARIGDRQARLRQEHLQTHLEQTALLEPAQIRQYGVLRGYGKAAPAHGAPSHGGQGHHGHHGHHGSRP